MPGSLLRFMKCAGPRTVTPWENSCLTCWRPWVSVLGVKLGNCNSFQRTNNSESGPGHLYTHASQEERGVPSTRRKGIRAAFWSPHLEKLVCACTHAGVPETGSKRQIPRAGVLESCQSWVLGSNLWSSSRPSPLIIQPLLHLEDGKWF